MCLSHVPRPTHVFLFLGHLWDRLIVVNKLFNKLSQKVSHCPSLQRALGQWSVVSGQWSDDSLQAETRAVARVPWDIPEGTLPTGRVSASMATVRFQQRTPNTNNGPAELDLPHGPRLPTQIFKQLCNSGTQQTLPTPALAYTQFHNSGYRHFLEMTWFA
jgi:hypothetical protein